MKLTPSISLSKCFSLCSPIFSSQKLQGEPFRIVEVGARDGLQNEQAIVNTKDKIKLIDSLSECGFKTVEAASYVSPKWVPQMADHNEVFSQIKKYLNVSYPVLVPNLTGLNNALVHNVTEIAVFTAASDTFCRKNTNCSMEESMKRTKEVIDEAKRHGIQARGYISTVIGCPYEGKISPTTVANIASELLNYGCYEVSLGDTIGIGNAGLVNTLLNEVFMAVPVENVAVHFHDTYGQALSNVLIAIEKGVRVADSSVGGLGGCPYAKGASGNLASEDLVYMVNSLGFDTGIKLDKLISVSDWICRLIGRQNTSRVSQAMLSKAATKDNV